MVKRIFVLIGGLLIGAALSLVAAWFLAELRLAEARIDVTPRPLMRELPEAQNRRERRALRRLEREEQARLTQAPAMGERLMGGLLDCARCHGSDLGGMAFVDSSTWGRIVGPNLTGGAGSVIRDYSDEDWVRAIRHGVGQNGRFLLLMPSKAYSYLDDDEMLGLLHYLKALPDVDRDLGASEPGPWTRFLLSTGSLALDGETLDHGQLGTGAPMAGTTRRYGEHLLRITGCQTCHGENLAGDTPAGLPPAPDIRPAALTDWSYENFESLMHSGQRPDGSSVGEGMPWAIYQRMSDDDLRALWAALSPR